MPARQLFERNHIREIRNGSSREGALHKFEPDRQRRARAGLALAEGNLLVIEAHPHTGGNLWRVSYEPGIGVILRGAGLSRGRPPQRFPGHARAELDDVFEHSGHAARDLR